MIQENFAGTRDRVGQARAAKPSLLHRGGFNETQVESAISVRTSPPSLESRPDLVTRPKDSTNHWDPGLEGEQSGRIPNHQTQLMAKAIRHMVAAQRFRRRLWADRCA